MRLIGLTLLSLLFVSEPLLAGAELLLVDGQRFRGEAVEQRDGLYHLELANGAVLPIPIELVIEVRLIAEGAVSAEGEQAAPAGDAAPAPDPIELRPIREDPGELPPLPPISRELSERGPTPHLVPRMTERSAMVEVLQNGPTSTQTAGIVNPHWEPESDYRPDLAVNDFAPSSWYQSPTHPHWTPEEQYGWENDVTNFRPSGWFRKKTVTDWQPTDGFSQGDR